MAGRLATEPCSWTGPHHVLLSTGLVGGCNPPSSLELVDQHTLEEVRDCVHDRWARTLRGAMVFWWIG